MLYYASTGLSQAVRELDRAKDYYDNKGNHRMVNLIHEAQMKVSEACAAVDVAYEEEQKEGDD